MTSPSDQEPDLDADADLIDRLYGEAADPALSDLRMVRGLVARVREERPEVEPPQAISARLLAAAAPVRAAAVEPERPGLWARLRTWFGGVAMHPGLAAAATLVIVAGAAAIWMRQGGKAATPTTRQEVTAQRDRSDGTLDEAPVAPAAANEHAGELALGAGSAVAPTGGLADDRLAKDAPAKVAVGRRETADKPGAPDQAPQAGRDSLEDHELAKGGGEADGEGQAGDDRGLAGTGSGSGGGPQPQGPIVTTKIGGVTPQTEEPRPDSTSPPPPPTDPSATTSSDAEAQPRKRAPTNAELARQLMRQATTAAKKQDCETVAFIARRVRKLDGAYYRDTFVKQPAIAACLK